MAAAVQTGPSNTLELMANATHSDNQRSQWFNADTFLAPDFNAEQYVADVRRYVSSSGLRVTTNKSAQCNVMPARKILTMGGLNV